MGQQNISSRGTVGFPVYLLYSKDSRAIPLSSERLSNSDHKIGTIMEIGICTAVLKCPIAIIAIFSLNNRSNSYG